MSSPTTSYFCMSQVSYTNAMDIVVLNISWGILTFMFLLFSYHPQIALLNKNSYLWNNSGSTESLGMVIKC